MSTDWLKVMQAQYINDVMALEDAEIFASLDNIGIITCNNISHKAFGNSVWECEDHECQMRAMIDT